MMAFKTAHFGAEPVGTRKSVPQKFGPHFLLRNAYKNVVQTRLLRITAVMCSMMASKTAHFGAEAVET